MRGTSFKGIPSGHKMACYSFKLFVFIRAYRSMRRENTPKGLFAQ